MTEVNLAQAGSVDLAIDRGASIANTSITLTQKSSGMAVDLSGLTFVSQVREDTSSRSALRAAITITTNAPATDGILNLSSSDVAALPEGAYAYDIFCNEWERYVIKGRFVVKGTVTRA